MRPEDYSERYAQVAGWPVHLTSYRLGSTFYCKADNVSPGALIAKATGATKQEAEDKAMSKARERLGQTRRHEV